MIIAGQLLVATPGTFRGVLVSTPNPHPGWIYVSSGAHTSRAVEISKAQVRYAESISAAQRQKDPARSLLPGADVRVTAEQDSNGEWRAIEVEILRLPPRPKMIHFEQVSAAGLL